MRYIEYAYPTVDKHTLHKLVGQDLQNRVNEL